MLLTVLALTHGAVRICTEEKCCGLYAYGETVCILCFSEEKYMGSSTCVNKFLYAGVTHTTFCYVIAATDSNDLFVAGTGKESLNSS